MNVAHLVYWTIASRVRLNLWVFVANGHVFKGGDAAYSSCLACALASFR